jgi:hypothetical protein
LLLRSEAEPQHLQGRHRSRERQPAGLRGAQQIQESDTDPSGRGMLQQAGNQRFRRRRRPLTCARGGLYPAQCRFTRRQRQGCVETGIGLSARPSASGEIDAGQGLHRPALQSKSDLGGDLGHTP